MKLWTDVIEPQELTVYARRSLDEIEAAKGNLAGFFPTELINDVVAKFTRNDNGLTDAAEYRAFDAESTIGKGQGGERVVFELPPVSRKERIGEYDQLRFANADNDAQRRSIAQTADRTVRSISNRLELGRGRAIETGRLTINENGFNVDYDLGRHEDLTVTAATLWDAEGSDPIEDLSAWVETYKKYNDDAEPGVVLMSRKVLTRLQRNAAIQKAITPINPRLATIPEINALLGAYGLPEVERYDRSISVAGKTNKVLSDNKLFFMPERGSDRLGKTYMGRTAEAGDPDYALAGGDIAGLVASAHKQHDPYSFWVRANAIALPVMTQPNASMVAEVVS